MNRLWIRISLVITLIVIFGMLLPIAVGIAVREFRDEPPRFFEQNEDIAWEELTAEEREVIVAERRAVGFPGKRVLQNLTPYLIGVTLMSIAVGVLLSRGISAPLSKLAAAARSIGARDLSPRVALNGSQEIRDVAQAFNEMAADLQNAETWRKNLLADVAHELRTPLSVLQGNLQAILDDVYELDKIEIARLYDQTRQLSRLVDDLRELAQAEANQLDLNLTEINLGNLAADIAATYVPIADSVGVALKTWILEGLPVIQGDRPRLTQCLQNLLTNAVRHTPTGGEINLTIGQNAETLEIQIADTGSGIAPEHRPYIFDRFYRADPARARETGGTGLGLAITRAIIQAHGGQIWVESAGESQGSTFIVRLPIK
jgi:signal transduction histidine kinase